MFMNPRNDLFKWKNSPLPTYHPKLSSAKRFHIKMQVHLLLTNENVF